MVGAGSITPASGFVSLMLSYGSGRPFGRFSVRHGPVWRDYLYIRGSSPRMTIF
jgi:hypothetical protein